MLDDYHWLIIIKKMTMVDRLHLSKTSSRFCQLINKQKRTAKFLSLGCQILHCQFIGFYSFRKFGSNFKFKFYEKYVHKSDQIYLNYLLEMFCDITAEKILPHLLWCTRNRFLFNCDLCIKVE